MKILVVGETCEDKFIYGECNRICPEGPVPVFNPKTVTVNRGMAGNVVANLYAMDYDCDFISNKNEMTKTRYIDQKSNQLLLRIDENDKCSRIEHNTDYASYNLIIISDYCKGFLEEEDIIHITKRNNNVFVDTKKHLTKEIIEHVKYIKINQVEYDATKYTLSDKRESYEEKLIVTKSQEGCMYKWKMYPAPKKIDTIDISGAGDTFMAAFSTKFIETKDIIKAIEHAQECTSIVIQKKGVSTI